MLKEFADDVVPMVIRAKGGGIQAVQVVLTSSKEDKDIFEVLSKQLLISNNNLVVYFTLY